MSLGMCGMLFLIVSIHRWRSSALCFAMNEFSSASDMGGRDGLLNIDDTSQRITTYTGKHAEAADGFFRRVVHYGAV
jgi:hypothetical protein